MPAGRGVVPPRQARILETVTAFHANSFTDDVTLVTVAVGERPAARRRGWRRRAA